MHDAPQTGADGREQNSANQKQNDSSENHRYNRKFIANADHKNEGQQQSVECDGVNNVIPGSKRIPEIIGERHRTFLVNALIFFLRIFAVNANDIYRKQFNEQGYNHNDNGIQI